MEAPCPRRHADTAHQNRKGEDEGDGKVCGCDPGAWDLGHLYAVVCGLYCVRRQSSSRGIRFLNKRLEMVLEGVRGLPCIKTHGAY